MRSDFPVMLSPVIDMFGSIIWHGDQVLIVALLPELAVESLDEGVFASAFQAG